MCMYMKPPLLFLISALSPAELFGHAKCLNTTDGAHEIVSTVKSAQARNEKGEVFDMVFSETFIERNTIKDLLNASADEKGEVSTSKLVEYLKNKIGIKVFVFRHPADKEPITENMPLESKETEEGYEYYLHDFLMSGKNPHGARFYRPNSNPAFSPILDDQPLIVLSRSAPVEAIVHEYMHFLVWQKTKDLKVYEFPRYQSGYQRAARELKYGKSHNAFVTNQNSSLVESMRKQASDDLAELCLAYLAFAEFQKGEEIDIYSTIYESSSWIPQDEKERVEDLERWKSYIDGIDWNLAGVLESGIFEASRKEGVLSASTLARVPQIQEGLVRLHGKLTKALAKIGKYDPEFVKKFKAEASFYSKFKP